MASSSLRILMTDPHLRGGGQVTYLSRLATALTRMGHHVTFGCRSGSVLTERAVQAGCGAHDRFVFRGGLRPQCWWHDVRECRRFIQDESPDILHVNGSQDHWNCALANRLLGRPVCLVRTRHNTYPVKTSFANRVLNRRWTDYQIVVCDAVRRSLGKQPTFDARRMCSIHNGVDAAQYRPDPAARSKAREEFGYVESNVVCGIAARLVPAKGHEFALKAAAQLHKSYPEMRLLVLGQGDLEASLRHLAVDLGLADIVHFAGFRHDIAYCTQAFDIAVLPSIDCDTSSFSLKEEMAAEKPVIASDYGGLKEIVSDGVEGLVAPAGRVAPLAAALRRLMDDPDARRRMGEFGRKRVLREFSIEGFAERTVAAYECAIKIHRDCGGRPR